MWCDRKGCDLLNGIFTTFLVEHEEMTSLSGPISLFLM